MSLPNKKLLKAAEDCNLELLKNALEEGADVMAIDNIGWTALIWASWNGDIEAVSLLLERGANVNDKDESDSTALIIASGNWDERTETVKLLLENGADIEAKNNEGKTAIMMAKERNKSEIYAVLVSFSESKLLINAINTEPSKHEGFGF